MKNSNSKVSNKSNFVQRQISGDLKQVNIEEIFDDEIDNWHKNPKKQELYEFLGFTKGQYKKIVEKPDSLIEILKEIKNSLPVDK